MLAALSKLLSAGSILLVTASADDWSQYMGPHRDGRWEETGIVEDFPAEGLKVKWRVPVDWGYAGPAVSEGRVFVMDYKVTSGRSQNNPGARDQLQGQEALKCFDTKTGKPIWTYHYDREYNLSFAGGPRCTPCVDEGRVYAIGAEGDLLCLDVEDGQLLWRVDFKREELNASAFVRQ